MNWSYVAEKNAKEYPEKEAIIYGDKRITYRELNKRVNALAKGLLDLGLGKGDVGGGLNLPLCQPVRFFAGLRDSQGTLVWQSPQSLGHQSVRY